MPCVPRAQTKLPPKESASMGRIRTHHPNHRTATQERTKGRDGAGRVSADEFSLKGDTVSLPPQFASSGGSTLTSGAHSCRRKDGERLDSDCSSQSVQRSPNLLLLVVPGLPGTLKPQVFLGPPSTGQEKALQLVADEVGQFSTNVLGQRSPLTGSKSSKPAQLVTTCPEFVQRFFPSELVVRSTQPTSARDSCETLCWTQDWYEGHARESERLQTPLIWASTQIGGKLPWSW